MDTAYNETFIQSFSALLFDGAVRSSIVRCKDADALLLVLIWREKPCGSSGECDVCVHCSCNNTQKTVVADRMEQEEFGVQMVGASAAESCGDAGYMQG